MGKLTEMAQGLDTPKSSVMAEASKEATTVAGDAATAAPEKKETANAALFDGPSFLNRIAGKTDAEIDAGRPASAKDTGAAPRFKNVLPKTETKAKPADAGKASTQESGVKTTKANTAKGKTSKTKPAAKAKAAPKAKAKTKAPKAEGPSGMVVKILALSCRAGGVTPDELNKLTTWKGAPWKWLFKNPKKTGYCDRWGYTLEVVKDDKGTHYKTTKKAA